MEEDYQKAQIKDKIILTICEQSRYSIFEVGMCHKKLQSIDKLLSCIDTATQERRSLEAVVDEMLEANSN